MKPFLLTFALLLAALPGRAVDFTGPNSANGSAVLTNMMVATAAPAKAYDVTVCNTSAVDVWVLAFDSATNVNNGNLASLAVLVPAGKTGGFYWGAGRPFRRGLTIAGSTTVPALTNTSTVLTIDATYLDRMW